MTSTPSTRNAPGSASPTRPELARYFLRLGATGFGGPVALVAAMHRDLLDERGWFTERQYRDGITLAQVSPGPLAAQLCFYLAYVAGGLSGAIWSAAAFVLPSFIMVMGLGWAYHGYGGLPQIRPVFHGVGAAVTGLLVVSGTRLVRRTAGSDPVLLAITAALAVLTASTGREPVECIVGAGLICWVLRAPPRWARNRSTVAEAASLVQIAAFFAYAGSFVFGSGLAIVPFLHGGLVVDRGWINEPQFLDAVAVALITPGPVVITTGFVGYLLAGLPGASVAAAATFLPCFVITVLLAPHVGRFASSRGLAAFSAGVTAAAIGSLAGAVYIIGERTVYDPFTLLVAGLAIACAWSRRVPDLAVILAAAGIGLWVG